jgi:alpha-L-fucosidase
MAETNTPRLMDVAGWCLLYDKFIAGIVPELTECHKVDDRIIYFMEAQDGNTFKRES